MTTPGITGKRVATEREWLPSPGIHLSSIQPRLRRNWQDAYLVGVALELDGSNISRRVGQPASGSSVAMAQSSSREVTFLSAQECVRAGLVTPISVELRAIQRATVHNARRPWRPASTDDSPPAVG
jgi:hypothetical protein